MFACIAFTSDTFFMQFVPIFCPVKDIMALWLGNWIRLWKFIGIPSLIKLWFLLFLKGPDYVIREIVRISSYSILDYTTECILSRLGSLLVLLEIAHFCFVVLNTPFIWGVWHGHLFSLNRLHDFQSMFWPILRLIFSLLILRFVFTLETLFFLWDRLTWRKILEFCILLAWSGRFVMSVLPIPRETHRWAWPVGSSASLWCMWSTCTWNRWSRLSSMTVDEAMRLVLFVHLFFEVIQI